jgi:hypothetical protein
MRWLQNLFIAVVVLLMLGDGIPVLSSAQGRLKTALKPVLDATALWQGSWRLFAPDVDRVNVAVSAEVYFADGTSVTWRSPDWSTLSFRERFTRYREGRYADKVRLDANRGAWPGLADYAARTNPHPKDPAARPILIRLIRHWAEIPPPSGAEWEPVVPLPMDRRYPFHSEQRSP